MSIENNIKHLITHCGRLRKYESLLIICDSKTLNIAKKFYLIGKKYTKKILLIKNNKILKNHGEEPQKKIANMMKKTDLIISLISSSIAHTQARKIASRHGSRFMSLPDYNKKVLSSKAIKINYLKKIKICEKIKLKLDKSKKIHITSNKGTNLTLIVKNRIANSCPGILMNKGDLGSPPDVEVNITPVENMTNGCLIVDGSVANKNVGILKKNIKFEIKNGYIKNFYSENSNYKRFLIKNFNNKKNYKKRRVLAELGIGLNHLAKLTGNMLTDEGSLGTIHFGFGSNDTIGGKNKVNFHLDFVIKKPNIYLDEKVCLIKNGKIQL
jgi:leucyl aminopeptidase (aminopeptidase T)